MLKLMVAGTFDWTKLISNSLSDNVTGSFRFGATFTKQSLNNSAKSVSFFIICYPSLVFIFDSLEFVLRFAPSSLNIFQIDLGSD